MGSALSPAGKDTEEMLLNVGGTPMTFPRDRLLRRGLRDTCLAVLLHRFEDWMVKDDIGTPFIDADPKFFIRLAAGLRQMWSSWVSSGQACGGDTALAFYYDRFMAKTTLRIEPQPGDSEIDAFRAFMAAMGHFIKTSCGGTGGTKVLTINGHVVSTTDATLAAFTTLNKRFTEYSGPVLTSLNHFHKVVDYARRRRIAPADAVIELPTCEDGDVELSLAVEMYGLLDDGCPNILSADTMSTLLSMTGKMHALCLFKSSIHGCEFETLLARAAGAYGLLFVIEDEHHHTLACHMDGPFIPPADPTSALTTGCPVTFFSISGPFLEGITKINIPHNWQCVDVAGTEGAVKTDKGASCGKVAISGGRLWLGHKDGRPNSDLRHCQQWLRRDDLPDGGETYMGSYDEAGSATLAATYYFTATRLEVYQVWSTRPADPILSADDLQALVDMATDTPMTAQLLYKGERDGWTYEALFAKVGGAVNLLLLFKDTGAHTFASHIKGQLKPPSDPTAVETTPCPVTFYSISGAFEPQGITKITVPYNRQRVQVAGIEGAVTGTKDIAGKVAIAGGRLWLGYQSVKGGPAGDLRSGCQWVLKDELPDGGRTYLGGFDSHGWATLAASHLFTCADLEIYTLQQA
ncbi:unnamed protein product [Vitrella brassicaformis CCMP3155]|uniref:TLDc domain-containing protein n=1 Tax=Vitrella brassicaformis (strain CCMP3155) TaxID=1169540 RepID=A0A0G4EDV0_VITBC|nr:unnamed protein product [Vitrella brassicaformis CCMP3155]|eukprot:CEL94130.1 unnamed protein product [Vitrella brassicaformis CCMP3155]